MPLGEVPLQKVEAPVSGGAGAVGDDTVEGLKVKFLENFSDGTPGGTHQFNVSAQEDDLFFYSVKVGDKTLEFGGTMTKSNGVLTINNFDIDGTMTNELGVRGIRAMLNDFGKQHGVNQLIINGAKRTTGANPGKITQIILDIK